jgi:hypothetical protein
VGSAPLRYFFTLLAVRLYMGIMKLQLIQKRRPFSFLPALTGAPGPFQHSDRQEIEK